MLDWLLDSDPSIRWQVMRDLTDEPDDVVVAERRRVAMEGWGARLLDLQGPDGYWAGGAYFPASFSFDEMKRGEDGRAVGQPWTATSWTLTLLRTLGLDPDGERATTATGLVQENCRWEYHDGPFFAGEVEPCINGQTVANGAYFGVDVAGLVDRLLDEQMADGGWNCEQENGSTRGSFHTTISVLDGLLEYETTFGPSPAIDSARSRGERYMLERRLLRSLTTGDIIDQRWTQLSFPTWWHYDVLWGLDYLRRARVTPDELIEEALGTIESRRLDDGSWPRQNVHPGAVHFEIDAPEGEPSRWNTLRALRVLDWADRV